MRMPLSDSLLRLKLDFRFSLNHTNSCLRDFWTATVNWKSVKNWSRFRSANASAWANLLPGWNCFCSPQISLTNFMYGFSLTKNVSIYFHFSDNNAGSRFSANGRENKWINGPSQGLYLHNRRKEEAHWHIKNSTGHFESIFMFCLWFYFVVHSIIKLICHRRCWNVQKSGIHIEG